MLLNMVPALWYTLFIPDKDGDLMARPKADTKQKILAKAAAVFRDHGYAGTSIRMISSRAKVNSALINYYFGDKKTLYLEVVRFWAQDAFRGFP